MDNLLKPSTSKYVLSDKNMFRSEKHVLELSCTPIKTFNVQVGEHSGSPVYMRTHVLNKQNWKKKPTIVFLHGYGAASCHYF